MLGSTVGGKPLFLGKDALGPVEKTAAIKADRDPSKWESNIMMLLHEQHPYLQDYDIRLHMNRSDPETGTAVGQLVLNDKVAIPVVIDGFKIQPFDVFWADGKLHPMTKLTLLSHLQDTGVGKTIEPGQGEMADMSIYNVTRAPFSGKYSFASGLSFSLDQYERALGTLGRDGLEYALATSSIFKQAAAAYAAGAKKDVQGFVPQETVKVASGWAIEPIDFTPFQVVKEPGAYQVIFDGFRKEAAIVFDVLFGWDGQVWDGKKFVLSLEKTASMAVADEVGGQPFTPSTVEFTEEAKRGDTGFFWLIKEGHALATWPVKFLYWGTDEEGLPFAKVADIDPAGRDRKICFSPDCRSIAVMGDTVLMSPEWHWHRCGPLSKVASAAEANKFTWPSDATEIRNRGLVYSIHGADVPGISKTGESAQAFLKAMSVFDPAVVADLMKMASAHGSAFCRIRSPKSELKKIGSAEIGAAGLSPVNLVRCAVFVKPCDLGPFYKIAVDVNEEQAQNTVDSILGLNFINESNIYKFLDHIEELEDASAVLAKLLLASKMGFQIESGPIKTALFALDTVVRQMKQLRSTTGGVGAE